MNTDRVLQTIYRDFRGNIVKIVVGDVDCRDCFRFDVCGAKVTICAAFRVLDEKTGERVCSDSDTDNPIVTA